MLYGLERFPLGELEVYEGESDVEKLWEKLSTGKYLLYAAPVDDNGKVETEWIKHQVGGMLTLVIGIIGILNFINSILTGIVTRQKEFAMMESIGMTKKQLTRMLIYEGCFLQALFGQNCKIFLDIVAKRFWTLLHVQIGQSCNAPAGCVINQP